MQPELDLEAEVINKAVAIDRARNKLRTFDMLGAMGVQIPTIALCPEDIEVRMGDDTPWFARSATGMGGTDIRVFRPNQDEIPAAEFYSRYIPNDVEFRMHVFKDDVIRYQKKCLSEDREPSLIKNHVNGYVYQTPALRPHQERFDTAIRAVNLLELDFGAVDLIVPLARPDKSVVLEVNTAPACSPLTLSKYVEAFTNAR